jgi:hypothetical protein
MVTKAAKQERERREAEWAAERSRVLCQGAIFEAIPNGQEKDALKVAMTDRAVWLFDNCRYEEGDALLEFLPNDWAQQLLGWYFDEDGTAPHPAEASAGKDEDAKRGQVQGEPQSPGRPDGEHPIQADAIGEPVVLKPLTQGGEGEPDREAGLSAGSPMSGT